MKTFIGITDKYDPEVRAMMAARYSRDVGSIAQRLPSSSESEEQHKESLKKFYVNYGHKSVGQLATTDIYLEGVSQLAAKAIENNPLFNGQESSTRYIDFANQPCISNGVEIMEWQDRWLSLYLKALPLTIDDLKREYPLEDQAEGTKKEIWENTIKARAFDICRGLLPAGITTNVVFTSTFDVINDHFGEMLKHPCSEMRDIATEVLTKLGKVYPYAAVPIEKHMANNSLVTNTYFYNTLSLPEYEAHNECTQRQGWDKPFFPNYREKYQKLSRHVSSKVTFSLGGEIDFGSFRDLQRHRPGYMNMPLLIPNTNFNEFYLQNLPSSIIDTVVDHIGEYKEWYTVAGYSAYDKQYCTPMGFNVVVNYVCDLNQAAYLCELRTGKTVHQTLRKLCQGWAEFINSHVNGSNVFIHADMDDDNFTLKRGAQTFSV